jgi:DNA-binding transcriptional MerR regulator
MKEARMTPSALERRRRTKDGPLTIGAMAELIGVVPGPWTLRRLEARGVIPQARRSLARGDRYYIASEAKDLRRAILAQNKRRDIE